MNLTGVENQRRMLGWFLFTSLVLAQLETEIIINDCGQGKNTPRAWYTCKVGQEEYLKLAAKRGFNPKSAPNLTGLADLNVSVSAQFCLDNRAQWLLDYFADKVTQSKLVIIDSRLEAHGFLDKQAISWHSRNHNWERRGQDISRLEADEHHRLVQLAHQQTVKVYLKPEGETGEFTMGRWLEYSKVMSERQWWQQRAIELDRDIEYVRIHQPDHCPPPDQEIDRLVQLIDDNPPGSLWFHVHCKGGSGRSVSMVALLDMLQNAHQVSFEDIITRQWIVGRSNLFSQQRFQDPKNLTPKEQCYRDRMAFLKLFYRFSQERLATGERIGWLEYLEKSNLSE